MNQKFHKALAFLGLVEEDVVGFEQPAPRGYEEPVRATEFPREPVPFSPPVRPVPPRPSGINFIDKNGQPEAPRPTSMAGGASVQRTVHNAADIPVVAPANFNETNQVVDLLKQSRPLLLNLHRIDPSKRRRFVDFTAGAIYALGGKINQVEPQTVFLVLPVGITVTPAVREEILTARYDQI
jgi:FtsZ-interacting cell division protein YlmF